MKNIYLHYFFKIFCEILLNLFEIFFLFWGLRIKIWRERCPGKDHKKHPMEIPTAPVSHALSHIKINNKI